MTDSRTKSLTESFVNILPGYWISFAMNLAILPFFAADYASGDMGRIFNASVIVGIIYTATSLARSYVFRRMFERLGEKENLYTLLRRLWK